MDRSNEFRASTVELAIKNGLTKLGLTEEEADIEVVQKGGIFSKAIVRIAPKGQTEAQEEIVIDEDEAKEYSEEEEGEIESTEETEEASENSSEENGEEEKQETPEEREARFALMKEMREKGKEFLAETVRLMGRTATVESKIKDDELCFYLGGENAGMFIGYKGETLEAIQTLLSHYLNSGLENRIRIVVDADFYRERRKKTLIALAKRVAKQAYNQHREIPLEPMNSYERRIIHFALQNSYDATTRSDGEGKERHVVIVPKSPVMSYGNASSDFRKKGPSKTKSFGYNKKRF